MVKAAEKAITEAGLGLNPVAEGQTIRIAIPPLTEERRKEIVRLVNKYAENTRIAIRNVRRDGMDEVKKDEKAHEISEDEATRIAQEIQTLTDKYVKNVDSLCGEKEKEIMNV